MSKLLEEIIKDPGATFQIEFDLPSGNACGGTVGPMVGNRLICSVGFRSDPTEEDISKANELLNEIMGEPPAFIATSRTDDQRKVNRARADKFMREGLN